MLSLVSSKYADLSAKDALVFMDEVLHLMQSSPVGFSDVEHFLSEKHPSKTSVTIPGDDSAPDVLISREPDEDVSKSVKDFIVDRITRIVDEPALVNFINSDRVTQDYAENLFYTLMPKSNAEFISSLREEAGMVEFVRSTIQNSSSIGPQQKEAVLAFVDSRKMDGVKLIAEKLKEDAGKEIEKLVNVVSEEPSVVMRPNKT
jgi:hypothetical protein